MEGREIEERAVGESEAITRLVHEGALRLEGRRAEDAEEDRRGSVRGRGQGEVVIQSRRRPHGTAHRAPDEVVRSW